MNSEQALRIVEAMTKAGELARISPRTRNTKAILFQTQSGRDFAVEINDSKSRNFAARSKLVFEARPNGQALAWAEAEKIAGVETSERQWASSAYKTAEASRLQPGRQLSVYVPTEQALRAVLKWYAEAAESMNRNALVRLKERFLEAFPDFQESGAFMGRSSFHEQEDDYKRALIADIQPLRGAYMGSVALGSQILDALVGKQSNLLGYYRTKQRLAAIREKHPHSLEQAIGELANSDDPPSEAAEAFLAKAWHLLVEGTENNQPYGESRILATVVQALTRPDRAISVIYQRFHNLGIALLGKPLFANGPLTAKEYESVLHLATQIQIVMREEWNWAPRDLWDVQGFIWVACEKPLDVAQLHASPSVTENTSAKEVAVTPTNLILYGSPGTGKTYRTASEAVRLCDGSVDYAEDEGGRAALMERYRTLSREGRIRFVTFHQNFSYEEFVEGLRPETGAEDEGAGFTGFRLEPRPGIFRELAAVAEEARKHPAQQPGDFDFSERKFWKMSLGEIGTQDSVYEEAISSDHIALGWGGDVDWSDARFETQEAIRAAWESEERESMAASNHTQLHPFRNRMKVGDIVVVPFGNSAFRAVGEVTGEYYYEPSGEPTYYHRRAVRWLVVPDEPLPLDTIIEGKFTMRSFYSIADARVNKDALGRLIGGGPQEGEAAGRGETQQFVLIIDEINRANISKVFGELITLIEPDKRLGQPNALKVRLPYSRREFGVPGNLHIIGTMNTADRSIALLDTALRRRFRFQELAPDPALLSVIDSVPLGDVLATINERIEYLLDRDHAIGHAFFMGGGGRDRAAIDDTMRFKVIPLLQEYFFEDWARIHAVLGDGFVKGTALAAPPGIEDHGERRSWSIRETFAEDAYDVLLGRAKPAGEAQLNEAAE